MKRLPVPPRSPSYRPVFAQLIRTTARGLVASRRTRRMIRHFLDPQGNPTFVRRHGPCQCRTVRHECRGTLEPCEVGRHAPATLPWPLPKWSARGFPACYPPFGDRHEFDRAPVDPVGSVRSNGADPRTNEPTAPGPRIRTAVHHRFRSSVSHRRPACRPFPIALRNRPARMIAGCPGWKKLEKPPAWHPPLPSGRSRELPLRVRLRKRFRRRAA